MTDKAKELGAAAQAVFTPGPWRLFPHGSTIDLCLHVQDATGRGIAAISQYPDSCANAHLIAAAPDLYEACKATLTTRGCGGPYEVYEQIRAAVAKAEGRSAASASVPPEPRSFVAGQKCDECGKKIAMACLPCDFGGCEEHAVEHNTRCPVEST